MRSLIFIFSEKNTAIRRLMLGWLLVMVSTIVLAQQKTINGVIRNADGTPVPKATVQVKGTNRGTTSDEKGEFTIQATANENLVISAIGFTPAEQKIGSNSQFTISLSTATKEMEAIVVTALGISRQQKALGFAAQQINSNELNDAKSNNWSSALSGMG